MAAPVLTNPAHAGVNPNQYSQGAQPSRQTLTNIGPEQHPTREDYDAAVTPDEQRRRKKEVSTSLDEAAAEKRKVDREEREKDRRKRDRIEKEKEEAEKKKQKEKEAAEKKYQTRRKHEIESLKQGLELPKYGMSRISSGPKQLASGNLLGKGVNFSGQLGQFNPGNIGSFNRGKMKPRFPKMTISAKGFQDPFAGMKMFPGSKRPGRKPKGSLFSLGLFRKR